MKYLFRDNVPSGDVIAAVSKHAAVIDPDHHDYHPHYELYLCRRPLRQKIILNGSVIWTQAPAAVLTVPFSIHAMAAPEEDGGDGFHRDIFYFDESFFSLVSPRLLPEECVSGARNTFFPLTEESVRALAAYADGAMNETATQSARVLHLALLLEALYRTVPAGQRVQPEAGTGTYIPQVLQYLYDHNAEPLSVNEVAKRFHISRAKLNRDFTASVGQPLHAALRDVRVANAKELLISTALPVEEIGARCGFADNTYFYAFFKRETGVTPSAFRRASQNRLIL